jgi:two-component system response regulator YesN
VCYKLIVADDEQIERDVLKLMIERELPDVQVVAEAKNGRQAVELGLEWQPDIMLVDIKMPGIDGLSAIRDLCARLPETRFVLVSAYDYFDYAKEALSLGVKEYLLKPASKQQVVETIRRLIEEIEQERARKQEEEELRARLDQLLPIVEKELVTLIILEEEVESFQPYAELLQLKEVEGFAIVARFHSREELEEGSLHFSLHKQAWYEKLYAKAKEWSTCLVGPMLWRQTAIFVLTHQAKETYSARVQAISLARRLCNLFSHEPVRLQFGIGNVHSGFAGLRQSYQEAVLAAQDPSVPASVHHYGDLPFTEKAFVYPIEKEKWLVEKVRLGKTEESLALFHQMLDEVVKATHGDIRFARRFLLECLAAVSRVAFEYQLPFDDFSRFTAEDLQTIGEIRQSGEYWLRKATRLTGEERSRKMGSVLGQVKQYLQEHYATDVTLEEVAEKFAISPYYLSKLFSQQCGITFIDYLTDLRMEEAKRLLTETQKGLKEIASEVGYANPNYFSRVFKKKTGVTPSEYKKV